MPDRLLCIDASGKLGWARWCPGYERPNFGVNEYGPDGIGQIINKHRSWMIDQFVNNKINCVAIEDVFFPEKTTRDVIIQQANLFGTTIALCQERGVPCFSVATASWRSDVLKVARAPKTMGLTPAESRKWIKDRAIRYCVWRGWPIENIKADIRDNAADALCILEHVRKIRDPAYAASSTPLFKAAST